MAYNILFTSMYAATKDEPLRYYVVREGDKRIYTDVLLTVEATTKYILSNTHIDEIAILGRQLTYDTGDDRRELGVDDGKMFYTSDINELSTYSLYRYRMAEFIDDLKIEQQEVMELLNEDEQAEVVAFLKSFFQKAAGNDPSKKFSRFFDLLVSDPVLYDEFKSAFRESVPAAAGRPSVYIRWVKNYLYMNMKDTFKMEMLPGNESATMRFIPTVVDGEGKIPIDNIREVVKGMTAEHEDVDIYVAINNDDMTDNFVMMSILDILDTLYGEHIERKNVITATSAHYRLAGVVKDDTEAYGMSSLVAAVRAFLQYGKADMIVDYWEKSQSRNEQVEKMIYAMKRIDAGLSLCAISIKLITFTL